MHAWILCKTYKCPRYSTFTFTVIPILYFIFYYMFFTLRAICKTKWLTLTKLHYPYLTVWRTKHKNGLPNQSINKYSCIKNVHASVHVGTYCVVIFKISPENYSNLFSCAYAMLWDIAYLLRQWPVPLACGNHATWV